MAVITVFLVDCVEFNNNFVSASLSPHFMLRPRSSSPAAGTAVSIPEPQAQPTTVPRASFLPTTELQYDGRHENSQTRMFGEGLITAPKKSTPVCKQPRLFQLRC